MCALQWTNGCFFPPTIYQSTTYIYLGYSCRCAASVLLAGPFWWNSSCFWLLASVHLVSFYLYRCFCGYKVLGRGWTGAWKQPGGGRSLDREHLPSDLWEQENSTQDTFQSWQVQPLGINTLEICNTWLSEPVCPIGTNHCHVQQVVDLQLLVDTLPVLLHLLLLLPGLLKITLVHGTLLFHIVPSQTLSHLKPSQQRRRSSVSWHFNSEIPTANAEVIIWKYSHLDHRFQSDFRPIFCFGKPLGLHLDASVPHHCARWWIIRIYKLEFWLKPPVNKIQTNFARKSH